MASTIDRPNSSPLRVPAEPLIEGLRSQVFSNYIFFFLVLSLLVFGFIIYLYLPKGDDKKLKTGEKVMFGAIIIGLFLAVIMGYVQLIEGYLI